MKVHFTNQVKQNFEEVKKFYPILFLWLKALLYKRTWMPERNKNGKDQIKNAQLTKELRKIHIFKMQLIILLDFKQIYNSYIES